MSQAELARRLAASGLPFRQQTVLKVEKGSRPLRLDEAVWISVLLRVELPVLVAAQSAAFHRAHHIQGELARLLAERDLLEGRNEELTAQIDALASELDVALQDLSRADEEDR